MLTERRQHNERATLLVFITSFNLGKRIKMVGDVPTIHLFEVKNARTGFVDEAEHQA